MAVTDKCEIKPGYRSDHWIINLSMKISSQNKGKGFWKFNTSLLHDAKYANLIQTVIRDNIRRYASLDQNLENPDILLTITDQLFWETLKMKFRQATIPYSGKKKREAQEREGKLIKEIELLNTSLLSTTNIEQFEKLKNLNFDLENIRKDKIKGMILRSKIQWLEEGEKPTSFFASLEKKNYTTKLISKININGNIIQKQNVILKETAKFYNDLYKSKINLEHDQQNVSRFLDSEQPHKLDEHQKQKCEGNISACEIMCAIKQMKHDKTPGIDGIPVEFYQFFWKDLGHFLIRAIRAAFTNGELSISQKRGIITCIPKGEKPREYF